MNLESNALVTVQAAGQIIGPVKLPVAPAAPGIFTLTQSAGGQAAVLNQDNTTNSVANPAARGTIIAAYVTGLGELTVPLPDGSLGPAAPPFAAPLAGVGATIGGIPAVVVFAGQAPDLVAGVTQVNVQLPENAPTGVVPISISGGGYFPGGLAGSLYQAATVAIK
jgi:uncharacterized protein (TIGR03437 family)